MSFRIVSDSSSNVYTLSGADYRYVSLTIHCDGVEFVDTEALDVSKMNAFLNQTKARSFSSCPNISNWLDAFEGAEEIFAISISSGLSGSFAAAKSAAEQYIEAHPGCKVSVIDSLSAGPGLCMLIEKLKECHLAGLSFEETDRLVREYQKETDLLFSLCSLSNFAKNGRVSMAKAKIAGAFGIRVMGTASEEGTLLPLQNVRGETKSLKSLYAMMIERGYRGGRVMMAHCMNPTVCGALEEMILAAFPTASVSILETGGLCSYYAEEGGLLVGFEIE